MRLTKTFWIFLAVAIMIAAGITLYMLFQGQIREQDRLSNNLTMVNMELIRLSGEREALEAEIAQLESDIDQQGEETDQLEAEISQLEAELSQLEDERAQAEAQALLMLSQAEAKFLSSVESIEYDEILFGFAHDANIELVMIEVSGTSEVNIDGIEYNATAFDLQVWGEVEDILDFVNTVVTYEAFKTSVLNTFDMVVPEPVTDEEISAIEETVRAGLTGEAISKITTEEILGYIVEAITDLTGDIEIDTVPIEEIAQTIRDAINGIVEPEFVNLIAIDLSQLIEEHIEGSIVGKILEPIVKAITDALLGDVPLPKSDIEELLGEDIAELLGDEIAGALPGDISGLLTGYISDLVEEKMMNSVEEEVNAAVGPIVAEILEEMEVPSSGITLVVYIYEGG